MAFLSVNNVELKGIAVAVPKGIKDVSTLKCFNFGEAEKVIELTGVKQSRIAPDNMVCSDYCYEAAENLINELSWDKKSIDLLIYISVSRDYIEPNTANIIQGRLGLSKDCVCLDIPMACSGYCYGLYVASSLMTTGFLKRAILLVGDTPSKIMSDLDKTVWPIHGDAGSATALEFVPTAKTIYFNLKNDGTQKNAIIAPATGVREPVTEESLKLEKIDEGIIRNRTHVVMDGMGVFAFTISQVPKSIIELAEYCNVTNEDVDYLLLHQANKYIDEKIRKKLKYKEEQVPYSLDEFGNTSSCTIPVSMVTRIADDLRNRSNKLLMSGFGAGLSWASVYLETNRIVVLPLIEI